MSKKEKKKAWTVFSKFIRTRDCLKTTGDPELGKCYTCDKVYPIAKLQAGHGISGRTNVLLFNEDITKAQCAGCNVYKGGLYEVFVPRLIDEIGREKFDETASMKGTPVKLDYKEIEKEYKKKLASLMGEL